MTTLPDPAPLAGRRIVLGVTGGIAAYKAIEVCRRLVDAGAHVVPVLTDAARNMVGETTFTALASEPVKTSLWHDSETIPHTHLGQTADLVLVCPATARIISDARTGRSADLLSATLIATEAPVVLCPAMHTEMWNHPAVQENLAVLADRGVLIVPPESGRLAGGDIGHGRLAAPETVVAAVVDALTASADLAGRHVVVSAGGTREAIDPVRFLSNHSSGRQGHALAERAAARGAHVTLVTTSALESSAGITRIDVNSAAEMADAVRGAATKADIVIMAAAVADFRPVTVADQKLKKADGLEQIVLERTEDILASLGVSKPEGQVLVGFAAETENLLENARGKLERKRADLLVANDVSAPDQGFQSPTNAVTILGADGVVAEIPLTSKSDIADAVLDASVSLLNP